MRKHLFLVVGLLALGIAGCGERYDPNLGQNPSKTEMDAAKQRKSEVFAIYDRAGGNWDSMSPADKARFIELSGQNEQMARTGWAALKSIPRN